MGKGILPYFCFFALIQVLCLMQAAEGVPVTDQSFGPGSNSMMGMPRIRREVDDLFNVEDEERNSHFRPRRQENYDEISSDEEIGTDTEKKEVCGSGGYYDPENKTFCRYEYYCDKTKSEPICDTTTNVAVEQEVDYEAE